MFSHRKRELAQSNCPLSEVMRWRHTATMQLLGVIYVCSGVEVWSWGGGERCVCLGQQRLQAHHGHGTDPHVLPMRPPCVHLEKPDQTFLPSPLADAANAAARAFAKTALLECGACMVGSLRMLYQAEMTGLDCGERLVGGVGARGME